MIKHASYLLCIAGGLLIVGVWLWENEGLSDASDVVWPAMGLYFIGKGLFIKTLYGYLPLLKERKE